MYLVKKTSQLITKKTKEVFLKNITRDFFTLNFFGKNLANTFEPNFFVYKL